jgi:hypothetical protein
VRFANEKFISNYELRILGAAAVETLLNTALLKTKGLLQFIFIKNAHKLLIFRSTAAASI